MSHYYEYKNQANKLNSLYNEYNSVSDYWEFMVNVCLGENGIVKSWRDVNVNYLIDKLCQHIYDLRTFKRIIGDVSREIGIAYSKADNTQYNNNIYGYYNASSFIGYWKINNINQLFINTDTIIFYADKIEKCCNKINALASRISAVGVTIPSNLPYYYGAIRRNANIVYSGGITLANVMKQCMRMYELADISSSSDQAAIKYITSLSIFHLSSKNGNNADIDSLYIQTPASVFKDTTSSLKSGTKGLKSFFATISEYNKKAKNLKGVKSQIALVTDNLDAIASWFFNEGLDKSYICSLLKTDASWAKTGIKAYVKQLEESAKSLKKNSAEYSNIMKSINDFSLVGQGFGVISDYIGVFKSVNDYIEGKEGVNLDDVISDGIDLSSSLTTYGINLFSDSKAAKIFSEKYGWCFDVGKAGFSFGYNTGVALKEYGADGEITMVEGAKAIVLGDLSGICSLISSATFGLLDIDAKKTAESLFEWADDLGYYAADKLAEKYSPTVFDKIGIGIESMFKGFGGSLNNCLNNSINNLLASNNELYYVYKASLDGVIKLDNYDLNSKSDIERLKKDVLSYYNYQVPDDNLSIEERLSKWNDILKDD